MKKNYFYTLFITVSLFIFFGLINPLNAQSYGTNLMTNGDFETTFSWPTYPSGTNPLTAGSWYRTTAIGGTTTSYIISGVKSFLLNPSTGTDCVIRQRITSLETNTTYRLSITGRVQDAQGASPATNSAGSRVIYYNIKGGNYWISANPDLLSSSFTTGTNTSPQIEFNTGSNTDVVIQFACWHVASYAFFGYLDDIQIQKKLATITTSSANGTMGSVSPNGTNTVNWGSSVTLTATPNSGYYFVNWTENGSPVSVSSTYTFNATADRTLVANFAQVSASMTLTGTLSSFSSTYGTASAEQSFTVSGSSLTTDIVITPPTGFEVSLTSGSGFQSTVSLTPSSGSVATTTVYVRMKALAAAGTYSAANITVNTTGSSQNVSCSGVQAKKALSITSPSIASKTYNGLNNTGTITLGTLSGFVGTETVTATATGTLNATNVGTGWTATIVYTLADGANGGLASNYSLANSSAYGNITSKQLDITVAPQSVTYGTAASTVTAAGSYTSITGFVNGETIASVISGTATYTTNYTNTTAVGTAGVTITYNSGLSTANGNYWFNKIAGTITITKANPTLSISGTQSFTFNGSAQGPATISYNGDGGNPTLLYTNIGGSAYSSATAPTNVGNYQVVASAAAGTNYNAATSSAYTFSITAATPTVTPTVGTYTYNGSPQGPNTATNTGTGASYTYSYAGSGGTSYGPSSTAPTTAGTYTVSATVAADGNYAQASSSATAFSILSPGTVSAENTNVSSLIFSPASDITISSTGSLVIDANTAVHSVTVAAGGKLTLNDTRSLTVTGGVILQNTASGTASFIDNRSDINPSPIAATVEQTITESNRNWYVAVPVTGKTSTDITLTGASIIKRNEAAASWDVVTGSLTAGVGYIAVGSATGGTTTWSLAGNLNSGQVEVPVTHSGASSVGFNLLGNPYPSYLNWEEVLNQNAANAALLLPTIWYRTAVYNNGLSKFDYSFNTYNSAGRIATPTSTTGYIPPMQAFWVRANSAGTVTFTNAMRSHGDGTTNKLKAPSSNTTTKQVLRLQVSNGTNTDETVIYTNPNASDSYDAYDSPKMSVNNSSIPEIYTMIGTEQLVINGLNSITPDQEIAVILRPGASTQLSVKATELTNFDSGMQILLRDYQNPNNVIESNLTNGSDYTFISTPNVSNRFALVFRSPSISTGIIGTNNDLNISVFKNGNGQITVSCPTEITGKAVMSVYNSIGQIVENKVIQNMVTVLTKSFESGVYFVHVSVNGKQITRKVVIN